MIIGISGKIGSGKDTVARIIQQQQILSTGYGSLESLNKKSDSEINALSQWKIKRFADKLKDTVCLWLGCTREQLEDREFKEKPLGKEWHVWWTQFRNRKHKKIFGSYEDFDAYMTMLRNNHFQKFEDTAFGDYRLTPRKLLQLLGTEAGRRIIHPDIWVNATLADYTDQKSWIIPDTRFSNESNAIKGKDGVMIRVERLLQNRFPEIALEYGYAGTTPAETQDALRGYIHREYPELDEKLGHDSEISLDEYQDWDYVIYNDYSMEKLFKVVKEIYEEIQ